MVELLIREPKKNAKKTPLLFIHGAWHGAWCWDENFLPYFAKQGYRVYALSLRGHGQSSGADRLRWSSANDYLADIEEVVNQLSLPPVIIGHSLGGYLVQKYLEQVKLPGAILLASVPPAGVLGTTLRIMRRFPGKFLKLNLKLSLYPLVETAALAQKQLFSPTMPAEQVNRYYEQLGDESYRAFLDMLLLNLANPRLVKSPILVLGGLNDTIFHVHEVKATAKAYHTEAHFFPMAHDMMLETGWEDVASTMAAWLAEQHIA